VSGAKIGGAQEVHLRVSKRHDPVVIVCSADASYVLPLTVMLVSVRVHLPAHRHLDIHIIDEHLPESKKAHIERSLDIDRVTISWHTADRLRLVGLPLWGRAPVCIYNKLLVPDVLSEEVHTALWLDSDTLVLGDVSSLWDHGTANSIARAVQDPRVPLVSSDMGVARYRELGLRPDAKYFNCGVMVMNVRQWREERVSDRALAYLKTYARDVAFWDQEGINAVLSGQWESLDAQWNWNVGVDRASRQRCVDARVKIAHFSGNLKPWQHHGANLYYTLYYQYIDRTVFAGFRPRPRWHSAALRSYEQAAFRRLLLPSEKWGIKAWRALTARVVTEEDVRTKR
jgi:lipopolysaccharide biosynthesis glycosyltransferase